MNSSFVSNADKETRISVLFLANIFKILIDGVLCIFVIINNEIEYFANSSDMDAINFQDSMEKEQSDNHP